MEIEPTDEDLRAFINVMLSNLDKNLREPEVIDHAPLNHRDMWLTLYRVSLGAETGFVAGPSRQATSSRSSAPSAATTLSLPSSTRHRRDAAAGSKEPKVAVRATP